MQDPSQGVDPRLLPHLHLLLVPGAPKQHRLTNNAVVDWLQKVPQLIKERPVSWQFIGPQENGTMFFEWLHPGRTDKFPSDGYSWLDVEHSFPRDISDQYVLDTLVSYCGVVPDIHPPTAFMRTRYRVRSKMNMPGPFDPSFWLVHYATADHQYQTMVQQGYQLRPEAVHIMNERRVLQQQGIPQRKDFMLVDRTSWPQVHYPSMARGGPPYAGRPGPGQHAPGQPPYAYAAANAQTPGPPAKRARQTGPAQAAAGAMPAPPVSLYHDTELELIEDVSSGDYLDNISPAQISRDRYKRHHQWLEEVFSSMHSPSQILPEDLGFGLVGELGELTKGLLNPPIKKNWADQERKSPESFFQDPQINASSVYKHLDAKQFADFEARVAAFVDAKNKEMDDMREQHAKMMSKMSKGKYYVDAEERLREAGADAEKIESIVSEVENKMGISTIERHDVVLVERGGLEDEEPDDIIDEPIPEEEAAVVDGHNGLNGETNGAADEVAMDVTGTEPVEQVAPQVTEPPAEVAAETADAAVDAGVDMGVAVEDSMDIDAPAAPTSTEAVSAPVQHIAADPPISVPSETLAAESQVPVAEQEIAPPPDAVAPVPSAPAPEESIRPLAEPSAPTIQHSPAEQPPPQVSEPTTTNEPEIQNDDVMGGGEPESMFDGADYGGFDDGIEGEFAAAEAGIDGGNDNGADGGGNGDDGLLDFSGDYGQSAGTGTTPTQTS